MASKTQNNKKRGPGRPATGQMPQHQFRCPDEEWELVQRAAHAELMGTSPWIRRAVARAAKRVLERQAAK